MEFGVKPLFHDVSFVINDRDRIALVGKNGAGKSTMLKILCGLQKPTAGVVAIPNETTLGYLPQVMKLQDDTTVKEETRKAFSHNTEMKAKLDKMQQEMAERTDYESDEQADDEIAHLEQELKAIFPAPEPQTVSSDMKEIHDFLSQKFDVHGARLAPELIDRFVEVVTPIADYSYRWKLNTGCKKSKEERTDLMAVSEKPILTFTIDFETAKRYWEASKMPHQFRRAAWTDLTVEVYL